MFNCQFSKKNCLIIPISSDTKKGKNAFNDSPWQQRFIPSALPTRDDCHIQDSQHQLHQMTKCKKKITLFLEHHTS